MAVQQDDEMDAMYMYVDGAAKFPAFSIATLFHHFNNFYILYIYIYFILFYLIFFLACLALTRPRCMLAGRPSRSTRGDKQ